MTSENVKIKINEIDNTSPAGSGTDSTDIAFIPGFSVLSDAPKNEPILCTTVREFEKNFGTKPRKLTSQDVKNYKDYGFKANDYDKSYIFAKELLYQGMSVIYVNLESKSLNTEHLSLSNLGKIDGFDVTGNEDNPKYSAITLTAKKDAVVSNSILTFEHKTNIPANVPVTFEVSATSTDDKIGKITDVKVELVGSDAKIDQQVISNNQLELITTEAMDVTLKVMLTMSISATANDTFDVHVSRSVGSCLDAFYAEKSEIKNILSTSASNTIADKSVYSVKYLTSGGYPSIITTKTKDAGAATSKFARELMQAAEYRGDAVALIDAELNPSEIAYDTEGDSFYSKMSKAFSDANTMYSYGAAMYPWAVYNCMNTISTEDRYTVEMPASFGYLMCVARAIKTSPNWLAMAGVSRGLVPNITKLLTPMNLLSNNIAEEMQPKFGETNHELSINCITNVRPYGLTLWGNRTLHPVDREGTVALNFLNTRNMLSDIKKVLYTTAKSLMFEQNTDTLWLRFKSGVSPLLNQLKSGNGISDYKIIKGTTKYNGDPLTKGEMSAIIKIYPVYAVEFFELTVEINDEDVTVS